MDIVCRRCLLKDMTDSEYYRSISEYVESLDETMRTPAPDYEARLAYCRQCSHLINGMCELCGCFVEVRAAKRQNHCAKDSRIW
ncbi:DUF6171 family protein [Caproiciproducens sp. LBM24188]|nr:hypothetical protein [Oscillospiraceae bacterium]